MRLGLPWDPWEKSPEAKKKHKGFDKSIGFDREGYQL